MRFRNMLRMTVFMLCGSSMMAHAHPKSCATSASNAPFKRVVLQGEKASCFYKATGPEIEFSINGHFVPLHGDWRLHRNPIEWECSAEESSACTFT